MEQQDNNPNAKSIGSLRVLFEKKENIPDKQLDSNVKLILGDLRMDAHLTHKTE